MNDRSNHDQSGARVNSDAPIYAAIIWRHKNRVICSAALRFRMWSKSARFDPGQLRPLSARDVARLDADNHIKAMADSVLGIGG